MTTALIGKLLLFANTIFYFTDFGYGTAYSGHDSNCNDSRLMTPDKYMMVNGVIGICIMSVYLVLACFCKAVGKEVTIHWIFITLYQLYNTIWLILGATCVWRDNSKCGPADLHDYLFASLVLKFIVVGIELVRDQIDRRVKPLELALLELTEAHAKLVRDMNTKV